MNPYPLLLIGVVCAGVGGELFVRGLVGLASWARVSAGIIATTVAVFATSSPEVSVAVGAALSGRPEISLGDALGSNVFNGLFIVGIAAVICPIQFDPREVRWALGFGVVSTLLTFPRRDGLIPRWRGLVLLALYFAFVVVVLQR